MAVDERFTGDYREVQRELLDGERSPIVTEPVTDWATDFSHLDPQWAADPYTILDDLRRRCPIAHTERFGGAWLPTRYADVAAIAYDTERFSSRSVVLGNGRPPKESAPVAPPRRSPPTRRSTTTPANCCSRRSPRPRSSRMSRPPGRTATS